MALVEQIPRPESLRRLYEIARKAGHKAVLDWLVLGSEIGEALLGQRLPEPSFGEFSAMASIVPPDLVPLLDYLVARGSFSGVFRLQELVEVGEEWSHPSQVLSRPRPTMAELLTAFRERHGDGDRSAEFLAVGARIELAAGLEERAARRRQGQVAAA